MRFRFTVERKGVVVYSTERLPESPTLDLLASSRYDILSDFQKVDFSMDFLIFDENTQKPGFCSKVYIGLPCGLWQMRVPFFISLEMYRACATNVDTVIPS